MGGPNCSFFLEKKIFRLFAKILRSFWKINCFLEENGYHFGLIKISSVARGRKESLNVKVESWKLLKIAFGFVFLILSFKFLMGSVGSRFCWFKPPTAANPGQWWPASVTNNCLVFSPGLLVCCCFKLMARNWILNTCCWILDIFRYPVV